MERDQGGGLAAAPERRELLPPRATRLDLPAQGSRELGGGSGGCPPCPPALSCALRIALRRMPSIRQTLQEMGVKVADVFPELRQGRRSGVAGPRNGTAPTLLTNYLDVRPSLNRGLLPPHPISLSPPLPPAPAPKSGAPAVHPMLTPPRALLLPDPVFWRDQHWDPRANLQGGLRHGLGQPVGAILQVLPPLQCLR